MMAAPREVIDLIARFERNRDTYRSHDYNDVEADPNKEIQLPPFKWDKDRRALLCAELDAYYAKLYGLTEEALGYILDPKDVYSEDFPSETFRVLKDKENRLYNEYRTKRLVLEAWSHQAEGGV